MAMQLSWISEPNNLSYFRSTSHPNASYQVSSQTAFQCLSWRPTWISDRDGLAIFDIQVTLVMLPT